MNRVSGWFTKPKKNKKRYSLGYDLIEEDGEVMVQLREAMHPYTDLIDMVGYSTDRELALFNALERYFNG